MCNMYSAYVSMFGVKLASNLVSSLSAAVTSRAMIP